MNLTMVLPRKRPLAAALMLILFRGMASVLADPGTAGPDVTYGKANEVAPVVALQAEAFPLPNMRLLAGPFQRSLSV